MFTRKDGTVQGCLIDWDLSLDLTLACDLSAGAQLERTVWMNHCSLVLNSLYCSRVYGSSLRSGCRSEIELGRH